MNWLVLLIIVLALGNPHLAGGESIAWYSAAFDPPSRAQLRMLRCALGDADLPPECQEIGRQISRLVIQVESQPVIEARASAKERVLMLTRALAKHRARVEITAQAPAAIAARQSALLADGSIEKIFFLIDGDSRQPPFPSLHAPPAKAVGLLFPLVSDGNQSSDPAVLDRIVEPESAATMRQLGLYREVRAELGSLQRALIEEGWRDYANDLAKACPLAIDDNVCKALAPQWKAIPLVSTSVTTRRTEPRDSAQLDYLGSQSEHRWAEKFSQTALGLLRDRQDHDRLKPIADDLAERTIRDQPRGKLPHLQRITAPKSALTTDSLRSSRMPITCIAPQESYNADMDQYLADRLPRAFVRFIKADFRHFSDRPVEVYLHDHELEQAYQLHRRDGFDEFYFLQTRRSQLQRDIYLAVKAQPHSYRVILTGVRGKDRRANLLCQLARAGVASSHRWVQAPRPQPLFALNAQGKSLKLDRNDWLLFGFRGEWRRKLLADNWRATPLTADGLEIDLYTHANSNRKLVTARNVYGDDAEILLKAIYGKGMRQAIYLGTAGAVNDYRVGDVVIPNEFVDRNNDSTLFPHNLAQAYIGDFAGSVTAHGPTKHGWVQTMFEETLPLLQKWKSQGIAAVDIEGKYLGKFAAQHKDSKIAALFVISDQTLGENTIEDSNANRGIIDAAATKLVALLYAKLLRPS